MFFICVHGASITLLGLIDRESLHHKPVLMETCLNPYTSFLVLDIFGTRTRFFNSLMGTPVLRDSCFIRRTCLRIPRDVFLLVFVAIL